MVNMSEEDISYCIPLTENYVVPDSQTVEILDLAFSHEEKIKIIRSPTQNYFYKNRLMRKVRRIRDLLGLVETEGIENILRHLVFKYGEKKLIYEENKVQSLIEWEEIEEFYVTEKTEYIRKRHLVNDLIYYINHSSNPVQAIICCLKAIKKMHLYRNLIYVEKYTWCLYFLSNLFKFYKEKRISNIKSHAVDILKAFCDLRNVQREIILESKIDLDLLMRITQVERFNFGSLWQEDNNDPFLLNWTLLQGDLKDFSLLLICGSPNSYDYDLLKQYHSSIKEYFEISLEEDLIPDTLANEMHNLLENRSFLCFQVLWLYLSFENMKQQTDSLILLWKSIPHPFLTSNELTKGTSCEILFQIFNSCFDWYYKSLKYEGAHQNKFPSPRSLQHLSLCSIRRNLARNFVVPSDESFNMEPLGLPKLLQEKVKLGVNVSLPEIV